MKKPVNYDTDVCGKVPLHQTNLIQPHGVLLITDKALNLLQASENCGEIFGQDARELAGQSLSTFIGPELAQKIGERLNGTIKDKLPFNFSLATGNYLAIIQDNDPYLVVEIEKQQVDSSSFLNVYQELKYAMSAVEAAPDTEETCNIAIRELKKISGFDKIMIYRFDEHWNGDVIAEVKEEGMDRYLGLKFPASDIPKQARELYRKTAYRLIPNIAYEPVRLYPVINPLTNVFTDLSLSNLRSVAAVHLEYLKNMGVTASMSTRILVDGQLWGLIACHHRTPKYLSFEMCSVFELLSNIISARVSAVQKEDIFTRHNEMQAVYTHVLEDIYRQNSLSMALQENQDDVLRLLKADGVAIVSNKQVESFGHVPSSAAIDDIVLWLQSRSVNRLYHEASLSSVYEPAEKYTEVASGLLALPIQPEKGNYILAFRPEEVHKVNWSGNPDEAVKFEADRKNYHPRNSFQLWQQEVRQKAVPWKPEEIRMAEQFRNFVVEYTLNSL